ncbi:MAG: gliding motility-associated C-terminal domain-containing protein [Bacteroidetes bacterium]|nr:gliding motility-associated C-terminal domain-containing protein [Bacteroidota bacterium]
MSNSSVTTCGGSFYDSGGSGGDYSNNENYTMTFCSANSGQCVRLTFTSFFTEAGFDTLFLYNGPTTGSPLIGFYTGATGPSIITANTGCLTVRFTSDGSFTESGWEATVSCVPCPGTCAVTCTGGPPPANDDCSGALAVNLPAPTPCPANLFTPVVINGTTTCATSDPNLGTLQSCSPSSNALANPTADVWYRITITAPVLNIDITGGIQTPQIALYNGNSCGTMSGVDCFIGGGGTLTTSINGLQAGSYWLQVGGSSLSDQCNFTMTLSNAYDCSGCVIASSLVANPPPVNGVYMAGQTVNFCYTINSYDQTSQNWLHGVSPDFGNGWDMSTLTTTPAADCSDFDPLGPVTLIPGTWIWNSDTVRSSATNAIFPPGFYFETAAGTLSSNPDNNAGNNYGDFNDGNTCSWTFCWSIRTLPPGSCIPGASLNVDVDTYGDGESGVWGSLACTSDPITHFFAELACCQLPVVSVSNINCSNGTATATATGQGTSPWDYVWKNSGGTTIQTAMNIAGSNSMSGLAAGTYTVTVTDDIGCTSTQSITVIIPTAINPQVVATNVNCNGGTNGAVNTNPSGGTGPYTYSWNPGGATTQNITNLSAGNYTVTVTDANGCTSTSLANVTQPTAITGAINPTQPSCGANNGSATVVPSGGTGPYTYAWSPSGGTAATASGLGAGNFSVIITDSRGCTGSSNIILAAPSSPVVFVAGITNSSCQSPTGNITVSVSGGTGPYNYAWSPSGGSGATASNLQPGVYTCIITDAMGCSSSATATIGAPATVIASISASTDETCPGNLDGTATASEAGGTPGYTYLWTPSGNTAATATGLTAGQYTVLVTDAVGCTSSASVVISTSPAINAAISSTPVLCNGSTTGSLSVVASGGNGTLTYSWSPSGGTNTTANNLSAGTYTVTVTDANGCTLTTTSTLADPALLSNSISSTGSICGQATGSATVVASGGTSPYSYAWTPAATNTATLNNLATGQYSVVITDANNCTSTATIAVADLPGPVVSLSTVSDVSCNGGTNGSATVQVTGGSAPLTYSWSPSGGTATSASSLSAGNYTVLVTDVNGCTSTTPVVIAEPALLTTTLTASIDLSCFGSNDGSIAVSVNGGTPGYNYVWTPIAPNSTTISNLSAGNYSVVVTDLNGCTSTFATTINEPTQLSANIISTPATCGAINGSAIANASGGAGTYTYLWSPSGGTNSTATGLAAGAYSVAVTDANGCTTSAVANISNIGGPTINAFATADVSCFNGNDGTANSSVANGTGPFTYLWSPSGGTDSTATNLSAGNYSVSVTDGNGCTSVANILISEPTAMVAQATSSPTLCFGDATGSASVNIAGGTSGYTYLWSPGNSNSISPTGLTAGNYSVLITDVNGCTTSASTTVNQPTQLNVTITPTDALCNGSANGSAQANASGGTSGYNYSWFPSGGTSSIALNLSAGNYTVIATDANGCTFSRTTAVAEPAPINLATSSTPATCGSANGTANVVAAGGAFPYSYLWSAGGGTNATASNLNAITYTVVVTDANGCTSSASESVSNTGGPTIATNVLSNVSCFGINDGSASVAVSAGTAPFNYQWSPSGGNGQNASNLTSGNYSITVTDANGCITNDNVIITEPTALLTQISSTDANCAGVGGSASVIVAGGTVPYSYSWTGSTSTSATASTLTGGNYTVTVSDGNGCTTSQSTTVNQPGGIATVINATPVTCNGGNNGSASVVANGGSGALTYSWSPSGGNNSSATNLIAGNYSVTVSDAGGCVSTASIQVTQPLAINLATNVTPSACGAANGSADVVASGGTGPYQYSWSPSGGSSATASNLVAGNYIVTVTDAGNCISTASALVINTGGPTVTLNAVNDVSCFGGNDGNASVNASGGNGPYTYSWSPYGGTSSTATNLANGNFTVTTIDANGCATAVSVSVSEPTQVSSTTTSTPSACGSPTGSATVIGSGGVGNYSYSWTGSTTSDSTLYNLTNGHYSVLITDQNGCTSTASINVALSNGANAILQSSTDVSCDGGSDGSAVVSISGGTPPYSYSWAPYGGTNANASGLSAGNYVVSVSDANNCSSTVNVIINDGAILILQTASTPASCNGGLDGSASVVVNGGASPFSYQWIGSSSSTSVANNLGIGNYTVTVTDANGCAEAEVATVNSATAIALNPISTDLTCNGDLSGTASVSPVGGTPPYSYQWTGNISSSGSAANLSGGMYSVTVTDINGCAAITNFNINEPTAVVMSVSPASTICIGQNIQIGATVTGGNSPYLYSWSNGATTDSISVSPASTTLYSVSVTDASGCTAATQNININVNPPLSINATAPATICEGDSVNLSSLATGGNGNYSYSWNNGEFITSNAIAYPTTDMTYTVVVTDNCGTPSASAQVNIIVSPTPTVDFGPGNLRGCSPFTVNFEDLSTTLAGSMYLWNFGDGNTSLLEDPEHVFTEAGNYDVSLLVTNSFGCTSSLLIDNMINVHESPIASFVSQPTTTTTLEPDIQFTNNSIGADQYIWNFGDGSPLGYDEEPLHTYSDTGIFEITLITISNAGCVDTIKGFVEVESDFTIYIPNAFTPNDDAINDHFNAYGIGWADYNLYILDRWGLNIYHSTNPDKPWDGTHQSNGGECQADVYVYKIQVHDTKGKLHSFVGHVSLVR